MHRLSLEGPTSSASPSPGSAGGRRQRGSALLLQPGGAGEGSLRGWEVGARQLSAKGRGRPWHLRPELPQKRCPPRNLLLGTEGRGESAAGGLLWQQKGLYPCGVTAQRACDPQAQTAPCQPPVQRMLRGCQVAPESSPEGCLKRRTGFRCLGSELLCKEIAEFAKGLCS